MSAYRILGLLALTFGLVVLGDPTSAQVKLPPQIKPGGNPGGNPGGKPPVDPKVPPGNPNPGPGVGNPNPAPGGAPGTGTPAKGADPMPPKKKDNINWPKLVNGKDLDTTIKDMRTNSDPGVREAAVRALPLFGPKAREAGSDDLIEVLNKETDLNVKVAAINVSPTIFATFATTPDTIFTTGVGAVLRFLTNDQMQIRLEALGAVATIGPYVRNVQATINTPVSSLARLQSSWQLRRAATITLGSIGHGIQTSEDPEKRVPPETGTVDTLLAILKGDACAAVRKEAVNSLIGLGPVAISQQKRWHTDLEYVFKYEKDKSVLLWAHVLVIHNSPEGLKGNESHLEAIAKVLQVVEPGGRIEACQALGLLGEQAVTKIDDLINIVNKENEPSIVIAAILALTNMPSRDAATVPILQNVQNTHADKDVRSVAKDAIDYLAGRKKKN